MTRFQSIGSLLLSALLISAVHAPVTSAHRKRPQNDPPGTLLQALRREAAAFGGAPDTTFGDDDSELPDVSPIFQTRFFALVGASPDDVNGAPLDAPPGAMFEPAGASEYGRWPATPIEEKAKETYRPPTDDQPGERIRSTSTANVGPDEVSESFEVEMGHDFKGLADRLVLRTEVKLATCPDANGVVAGTYIDRMAYEDGPASSTQVLIYRFHVQVDANADITTFTVDDITGSRVVSGPAGNGAVEVKGGSIAPQPWNSSELTFERAVVPTRATGLLTTGRSAEFVPVYATKLVSYTVLKNGIAASYNAWTKGLCVTVKPETDKKILKPRESAVFTLDAVHRVEGGRPAGAMVDATDSYGGSTITPDAGKKRLPIARYTYTAGPGPVYRAYVRVLSRRGRDIKIIDWGEPVYLVAEVNESHEVAKFEGAIQIDGPGGSERAVVDGPLVLVESAKGRDRWQGEVRLRARGTINWPDATKMGSTALNGIGLDMRTPRCDTPWTGEQRMLATITMATPAKSGFKPDRTPEATISFAPRPAAQWKSEGACNPDELAGLTFSARQLPLVTPFLVLTAEEGGMNSGAGFKIRWPVDPGLEPSYTIDMSPPREVAAQKLVVKVKISSRPLPVPDP